MAVSSVAGRSSSVIMGFRNSGLGLIQVPEGPSTQRLSSLVPNTVKGVVLEPATLNSC